VNDTHHEERDMIETTFPPDAGPDGLVSAPAVAGRGLTRRYGTGASAVDALRGVSLELPQGQFTAVMGPSGSGKSTLMHLLAGLDTPTEGSVRIGDTDLSDLGDDDLTKLRRDRIGFVFQAFNLLPMLSVEENVLLPSRISGRRPAREWVDRVIDDLGLAERRRHLPSELSGGQQQRVAIARAIVGEPTVLFADEPTGNLDSATGAEILAVMRAAVDAHGQTTLMVTHDPRAAAIADRVVFLADGRIVQDLTTPDEDTILEAIASVRSSSEQRSDCGPSAVAGAAR
jgi:putative ABC transport system ATP-binding protein